MERRGERAREKQATIAVDLTMRARLFAVALDFLATAFIARARHTTALLQRQRGP